MSKLYPSLPQTDAPARRKRVCLVTTHTAGPARTSGLGTATLALGKALAADGHEVTILYLRGMRVDEFTIEYWIDDYRRHGVTLVPLPEHPDLEDAPYYSRRPYETFLWLKAQPDFDVIHYSDCYGPGYAVALAKRAGIAFAHTLLVAGVHGASDWLSARNGVQQRSLTDLAHDRMERSSIAQADIVISPSHYMLNLLEEQGWALPERCYVQPNILPASVMRGGKSEAAPIKEIVFFGRLETGKGLEVFCDACDVLNAELNNITVTFLGNAVQRRNSDTGAWLKTHAAAWPFTWRLETSQAYEGGQAYLRRPGVLAVMPSLAENSPYTVLECLAGGVPFLASAVGGIPELIDAADVARVCFDPRADVLAERLRRALRDGVKPARPATDFDANKTAWLNWYRATSV